MCSCECKRRFAARERQGMFPCSPVKITIKRPPAVGAAGHCCPVSAIQVRTVWSAAFHNSLHGCVCIHLGEDFPREAVPCPEMDHARMYDLARTSNACESLNETNRPSLVRTGNGLPHGSYDTVSCRQYRNIQSSVNTHVPALFLHWPSLDAASSVVV